MTDELILIGLMILCVLFFIAIGIQMDRVFDYLEDVQGRICSLEIEDYKAGREYRGERWVAFLRVSPVSMVFRPWKPLDSWFEGQDFNVRKGAR